MPYIKTKCNRCGVEYQENIERCEEEKDVDSCGGEFHEVLDQGFVAVRVIDLKRWYTESERQLGLSLH